MPQVHDLDGYGTAPIDWEAVQRQIAWLATVASDRRPTCDRSASSPTVAPGISTPAPRRPRPGTWFAAIGVR